MILVVDDFEPQRYVRRRQLEAAGFFVQDVPSVSAAWQVVSSQPVRLVLSDIGLADGNGIAFCAELKRQHPTLPVVLVTATYRTAEIRRDALAAGADAILTEPLPEDQLLRVIGQVLATDSRGVNGDSVELWTDPYGAITDVSADAAHLLNVSARHCLGRRMHLFFAYNRPAVLAAIERASNGHIETFSSTIRPRDMRPLDVSVRLQPKLEDPSGVYWQVAPVGDNPPPRRSRPKSLD